MTSAKMNEPEPESEIEQTSKVNKISEIVLLASFAWESYLEQGRGVVIVDYSHSNQPTFDYWNLTSLIDEDLLDDEYKVFINKYNPKTTIIMIVMRGGSGQMQKFDVVEKTGLTCTQIYKELRKEYNKINNNQEDPVIELNLEDWLLKIKKRVSKN